MSERKDWTLSRQALQRLVTWLDAEADEPGHGYLIIRRRLVAYFDRRNCGAADELADDVLNRVARRLEEEGTIETDAPAKYCFVVARYVLLEHLREEQRAKRLAGDIRQDSEASSAASGEERRRRDRMLECLERCAANLPRSSRELIEGYYAGSGRSKIENRRALAARLGITVNALSIRACRIRDALFECVTRCLSGP